MKGASGSVTGTARPGVQSTRVPITQQPPRLQKQLLAQQQQQQQQGTSQPTLWTENTTPQILSKPAASQHKLLWPYSLQQQQKQPEQSISKSDGNLPSQNDTNPGKVGMPTSQQASEGQGHEQHTPSSFMNMPTATSDFRYK